MESYRITRKIYLERIWLTDMDKMIADRKLCWLGKCVRMDNSRMKTNLRFSLFYAEYQTTKYS